MKNNDSLTWLDLSSNLINKKGAKRLVESLQINNKLTFFNVSENKIREFDEKNDFLEEQIDYLVDCNKEWSLNKHNKYFLRLSCIFVESVFTLLLILRRFERYFEISVPKMVFAEIIKRIDRKTYFNYYIEQLILEENF